MNNEEVKSAIKQAKEHSKKRNFSQSVDVVFNLKGLDLKKPDHKVNAFTTLPNGRGRKIKICALVGGSLHKDAKENCDLTILNEEFDKFDMKKFKEIARTYDFFIAQADIMPQVAKSFGRVLGVKGKMPNPKFGQVVPPKGTTKPLVEKFQKVVKLVTKNELAVKCSLGMENMADDKLAENFMAVYKDLIQVLPLHEHNVRNIVIKTTMGEPSIVGGGKK